jgi:GT2 family glycosyltransferase
VNRLTVVIPSKTITNLIPCLLAVCKHEPDANIVVIDDGLELGSVGWPESLSSHKAHIHSIDGVKPFIFARNCNLGINYATINGNDVVLLNDDAILETPGGFTVMQKSAMRPEIGVISATTNHANNPEQHRRVAAGGPRTELRILKGATPGKGFPTVAFVCVLIPRRTIDQVGLLDERFGGTSSDGKPIYGFEDNDYCRRVAAGGLTIGIHDGCYVDHGKLRSTFRSGPFDMEAGKQTYLAKWGSM